MYKIISFAILCMLELCFGQNGELLHDSKFAISVIGGLNYGVYIDKWDWYREYYAVSAPRANMGIHLENKLSTQFGYIFELSYLRLFYNVKLFGYVWDTVTYSQHYTFDNLLIASELDYTFLRKNSFSSNLGFGLAVIWPFGGVREEYLSEHLTHRYVLSYRGVAWRKALFLLGSLNFKFDILPVKICLLYLRMDAQYPIVKSSLSGECQVGHSIPLRFNMGLLFKLQEAQ